MYSVTCIRNVYECVFANIIYTNSCLYVSFRNDFQRRIVNVDKINDLSDFPASTDVRRNKPEYWNSWLIGPPFVTPADAT